MKAIWLKSVDFYTIHSLRTVAILVRKIAIKINLNQYYAIVIKLFSTATIILFILFGSFAQQNQQRNIWIFATEAGNASFITQKSIWAKDAAGLKERDIQVHEVIGLKANQAVFKKYKASAQKFTFVLFGKDGGEKLRSHEPVSLEKLYQTIDDMPMRKAEMKQGKH